MPAETSSSPTGQPTIADARRRAPRGSLSFVPTARRPAEDTWQPEVVPEPVVPAEPPAGVPAQEAAPAAGPTAAPPRRGRRRPWAVLVVAAVVLSLMAAAPRLTLLAQAWGDPAEVLGPDRSALVLVAEPGDLPAPVTAGGSAPTAPAAGSERLRPEVLGPTTEEPSAFLYTDSASDGTEVPVTWSPCRPVHVVLNPDGGPADAETQLLASLGALSAATGLQMVYDGTTDEPAGLARGAYQPERYGDRWAPVLVGFSSEVDHAELGGQVAGLGGPVLLTRGDDGPRTLVSGAVTIDVAVLDAPPLHGAPPWVGVLRHELGHLVGLAHVEDPTQLMYPRTAQVLTYQDGDLAGLARLGAGPCGSAD